MSAFSRPHPWVNTLNHDWEIDTLDWVPAVPSAGGPGGGGDASAANQVTGNASLASIVTSLAKLTSVVAYNGAGDPEYIGLAAPGSSKAAAVWQIEKVIYNGSANPTDFQYAGGSAAFNQVWNNYAALSYS